MKIYNIPQENIRFYIEAQSGGNLFVYKEHSRALRNANAFKMDLHIHPSAELLVVTSGEIILNISDKNEEIIHTGEAALIFPFQTHGYSRQKDTEYFRFNFSTFLAKSFFKSNENYIGEKAVFKPNFVECNLFLEKLRKKERPPIYKIKSFLYSMISDYLDEIPLCTKNIDDRILTRVIYYMDQHKKEPIALRDVATSLGYNEKYLSRCINKTSGISFTTLLSTLRMDDARIMLTETNKTILEIAIECGFGTERTFYRHFKELLGVSPKTYRKNNNRPAKVYNEILL